MIVILQIVSVAIGFGVLIFIHELGHFTAARLCKVRVLTFSFGFGPDLVKFIRNETKYCIKLIPFGGFVAMAGEDPEKATGEKGEYLSLPWYKKIFIAFTGPLANYILAVALFAAIFNFWGAAQVSPFSQIGAIVENMPAYEAGLEPGDTIKSINGVETQLWADIANNLKDRAEKETNFLIERDGKDLNLKILVGKNPVTGAGVIGISPQVIKEKTGFFESFEYGARAVIMQSVMTVLYLGDKIVNLEKPDLSGPIGIMQIMAKATNDGLEDYLTLLAVISVALGLFNLFPIPFVDGGMIVLFLIEGIRRKRVGLRAIQVYNTVGIVIIGGIFIFATYSDLIRLGIGNLFK
ncbi:MAG: M50 family metallopeptidase [Elusimicrobiota bacterium]|jgi:regulator of sigma E protease|nr:M50 family metallopeptidase [Elusimicrobiota bacterium]